MDQIFYIDTAIWIDCYEDRKDKFKDLGKIALIFFNFLLASKSKIVISNFLMEELSNFYSLEQIKGMMLLYEHLFIKVNLTKRQMNEAQTIRMQRKVPLGDAIHAVLARDNNAILITRDGHFKLLKDICNIAKPEELT
ncbi:MAG: PIN domain-containing protein [Candidatus Woesearchaeota archaeon]